MCVEVKKHPSGAFLLRPNGAWQSFQKFLKILTSVSKMCPVTKNTRKVVFFFRGICSLVILLFVKLWLKLAKSERERDILKGIEIKQKYMNFNQAPKTPDTGIETADVNSVDKKTLTPEEQSLLDAKYGVEKPKHDEGANFAELRPDDVGNRRVEVNGQKYILEEVFDEQGNKTGRYVITPYTRKENGEVAYGEQSKDMSAFKAVMAKISPEALKQNVENVSVSLRRLSEQYDQKSALGIRKLLQESIPDDEQEKMAQDIFNRVDTRKLYDAYFSGAHGLPSPLKGTTLYRKLFALEDARLKQAGYPEGLKGTSI